MFYPCFKLNERFVSHAGSLNLFCLFFSVCFFCFFPHLISYSFIHSCTHLFSYSSTHACTDRAKEAGYNQSFWRKSQHAISSAQTWINVVLGTQVSLAWWITRGLTIMEMTIDWSFVSMVFRFMLGDRSIDISVFRLCS